MFGSFFGTLQNLVYIVECVTEIVLTLNPIFARSAATTWAVFEPGGVLSDDHRHLRARVHARSA